MILVKTAEMVKSFFLHVHGTYYILRLQSNQVKEGENHIVL